MLFKTFSNRELAAPILVRRLIRAVPIPLMPLLLAAGLGACGQQGALYIPTDPAAANRATLPQTLRPGTRATPPGPTASASASSPAPILTTQ